MDPYDFPRVTFGIIALNAEPFIRYCIRALYPHAYQIIVVEGAVKKARDVATADGHSLDTTRETLNAVKANEDPEGKLTVISQDGFWPDKVIMSHAYTDLAAGDYLWQVDSDEFYRDRDIDTLRCWIAADPSIDGATFRWRLFWGNECYLTDGWYLRTHAGDVNRLFRWEPGFYYDHYGKHPNGPTVTTPEGYRLNDGHWLSASYLAQCGIYLYHFSLVFPEQVLNKAKGYVAGVSPGVDNSQMYDWAQRNWLSLQNPFRVHNRYQFIAWLQRYRGPIPHQAAQMFADIRAGRLQWPMRDMQDAERIERSPGYRLKRATLRLMGDLANRWHGTKRGFLLTQAGHKWVDAGTLAVLQAAMRRTLTAIPRYARRLARWRSPS